MRKKIFSNQRKPELLKANNEMLLVKKSPSFAGFCLFCFVFLDLLKGREDSIAVKKLRTDSVCSLNEICCC